MCFRKHFRQEICVSSVSLDSSVVAVCDFKYLHPHPTPICTNAPIDHLKLKLSILYTI